MRRTPGYDKWSSAALLEEVESAPLTGRGTRPRRPLKPEPGSRGGRGGRGTRGGFAPGGREIVPEGGENAPPYAESDRLCGESDRQARVYEKVTERLRAEGAAARRKEVRSG
eukprot:71456-Prorocentrum_minimum.AAC.1